MAIEPGDPGGDAPGHADESQRLAGLRRFDFVDPEPGDILNRFARLAAQVFDTQFGALCFVETERVRFVARHGLEVAETSRRGSFFEETIRQDDIVWIADASEVVPFRDSPLVAERPGIRFYAGAPLKTPDGFAIGALCVLDPDPRPLADLATRGALADLAACAMSEMECWRLNRELEALTAERDENLRELDLIYERAPVALTLIDRDLRCRRINHHLAEINGKPVEELLGGSVRDVVPGIADTVEPLLRRVLESGEPITDFELIGETAKEPGVERIWMYSFYPIPGTDGRAEGVAMVIDEVTEKRRAEAALSESEALFRETFEQTAVGMAHLGLDGQWLRVNDCLCEIAGYSRAALLGKTFQEITHPEDVDLDVDNARSLVEGKIDSYSMDKRYVRADGSVTWVGLTVALRRTASGEPDHFISVVQDINPRKKAEERLGLVVSELNHRFKNTLATIHAVVAHGANEPTPKHEFVRSVGRRIQAMARAYDLLVRSQWRGAAMADLVDDVLRPYASDGIRTAGPSLSLTPNAALGFCLMIHELATNAAKYGALTRPEGRVSIAWKLTGNPNKRSLFFSWEEQGGPPVTPPSHRGFGSKIIEQYAATELGGTASISFDPEGVKVSLWLPLESIMADPPPDMEMSSHRDMVVVAPALIATSLRVLVVEDSALIAMDLESILTQAGHTVIGPASTVTEALELADEGLADIALLDVDLHGELVTPMAERLSDLDVPFAFSTGFQKGGSPLPVFTDAPVLSKPFDDQSVLSTIATLAAAQSD